MPNPNLTAAAARIRDASVTDVASVAAGLAPVPSAVRESVDFADEVIGAALNVRYPAPVADFLAMAFEDSGSLRALTEQPEPPLLAISVEGVRLARFVDGIALLAL